MLFVINTVLRDEELHLEIQYDSLNPESVVSQGKMLYDLNVAYHISLSGFHQTNSMYKAALLAQWYVLRVFYPILDQAPLRRV
jgi:hypothetical protein